MRRPDPPPPRPSFRRRRLLLAALVALLVTGAVVIAVFPPTETVWYPKCVFHEVTGYHCPGCGTARAQHALSRGRLMQALVYNPFTVAAVLYAVWEPVTYGIARWRRRPRRVISTWVVWAFVGLLMVFGIVRNIPYEPFSYLAPHELTG